MSHSDDRSPLSEYRAKRSGDRTGEPLGGAVPPPAERAEDAARLFVVQMHAARRLHWDLRLEIDGVLRSWAVPRGPSFDPAVKRLAVMTEDHPMEYVDFEGVIPDGNYGAGAMIVWDRGVWVAKEPIAEGFKKGKLLFELRGHKLRGVWTLVRTKGTAGHGHSHGMAQTHGKSHGKAQGKAGPDGEGDGNEWLLIKKPDSAADANAQAPGVEDRSILSGLTVEELRRGSDRGAVLRAKLIELGAPRRPIDPMKLELMLAETVDEPFSREGWVFELKYDGYRMLAARVDEGPGIDPAAPPRLGSVRGALLRYRSGLVCTHAFPEIARAIAALPFQGVMLDGEVVVLDDDARPSFQRLQRRGMLLKQHDVAQAMREHPVVYYAFDLLAFEGFDVRPLPLLQRKALLQQLLPPAGPLRFADHIPVRGQALFEQVRKLGLEGMLGKRADAPYQSRRSSDWSRVRVEKTDDFVIVGFTEPEGSRTGLGSLHLGAYRGQELVYSGRVGTGLTGAQLLELRDRLEPLIVDRPPCRITVASGRTDEWVEPLLCCEVRFRHRTEDHLLRLPVFVRMRDDKRPHECRLPDDPGSADELHDEGSDAPGGDEPPAAETRAIEGEIGVDDGLRRTASTPSPATEGSAPADDPWAPPPPSTRVVISNPDKVFWPESGYTKQDLVDYYREISPFLLPYLRDRPLVLTRYPDGIDGKWFFQKNAPPFVPEWIRTQTMWSEHESRELEYFVVNDLDSLSFVANLATIPLHVWGSRLADLPHPDWCILDLDPKGAPFEHVVRIALAIHALCDEVGLPNYCKTSGSTGLHVLMPLGGQCTFEQCRQLAQILGRLVASQLREIATGERSKRAREGKVYIDYVQNGHGRLLVSAFSVRPRPGAPVSTPLHWEEVVPTLDHQALTIKNVPARMRALGRDPLLPVLTERPDLGAVLGKLAARLGS
jgi:bifunctional non-homologous end joining protein LigD